MRLDPEGIEKIVKEFEDDARALKDKLFRICWSMRGGLTYPQSLLLDIEERKILDKIVIDHLETTKETGLPYF